METKRDNHREDLQIDILLDRAMSSEYELEQSTQTTLDSSPKYDKDGGSACEDGQEVSEGLSNIRDRNFWRETFKHLTRERAFFLLFSFVCLLSVSHWNTSYKGEVRRLDEKERYLLDLKYKALFTTAELVRLERINNIETSIQTLGLDLEHSTHPPLEIVDTLGIARN